MECGDYDGRCANMARGASGIGLQLNFSTPGGVPVAVGARLPGGAARAAGAESPAAGAESPAPRRAPRAPRSLLPDDAPFMNDMDEISYWIYTKRAPCLMNYDKLMRKQGEEAQCSKTAPEELPSPRKKKKKRKLSMLDEDSASTEKPQNVYFEVTPKRNLAVLNSHKSASMGSDVDFKITATEKNKKVRLQKNNRAKLHKKAKLVTSTPKAPVNLRRSLRRAQQTGDTHLDSSFEIFNTSMLSNGHLKTTNKANKSMQMFETGDCNPTPENKRNSTARNEKCKTTTHPNGQFEDMSDVSGFTANYIRSTKVQSGKTPKKLRCKSSRAPAKESQPRPSGAPPAAENMVVCVNKSMNTEVPATNMLNCSTDSSQNVVNLVTTRSLHKSSKMDKSTSLLKFVDVKGDSKEDVHKANSKRKSKNNLNISFQSQSSAASRYPKRYKNHTDTVKEVNVQTRASSKNRLEYNHLDKKENPGEAVVSRTRSGRKISASGQPRESSVLVVSNSTEQVSSLVSMNVADGRAPRRSARCRRPAPGAGAGARESTRERSGFAACFSESDEDSVPLLHRKYFCN